MISLATPHTCFLSEGSITDQIVVTTVGKLKAMLCRAKALQTFDPTQLRVFVIDEADAIFNADASPTTSQDITAIKRLPDFFVLASIDLTLFP